MLPTVASYFSSRHARRRIGGEDHAAKTAAQLLEIIDRGPHRGLAHQPHQYARAGSSHRACRLRTSGRDRLAEATRDAPRSSRRRCRRRPRCGRALTVRGTLRPSGRMLSPAVSAVVSAFTFTRLRLRRRGRSTAAASGDALDALQTADHRRRLLGLRPEKHLPQATKRGLLVAHRVDQILVRPDHLADRLVVLRVESCLCTPQNVIQLAHVQLGNLGLRLIPSQRRPRNGTSNESNRAPRATSAERVPPWWVPFHADATIARRKNVKISLLRSDRPPYRRRLGGVGIASREKHVQLMGCQRLG